MTIDEDGADYDKFWNRAMFPIMDVHNKVIGFGGTGDGRWRAEVSEFTGDHRSLIRAGICMD